jgi:PPOX class probable FMN-dependent enzyme
MLYAIQWLRSLVFIGQMYLMMAVLALFFTPMTLISRDWAFRGVRTYCRWVRWTASWMVGLRSEVRGPVPEDEVLVAAKHQSFFDIIIIVSVVPRPKFIMKKELMWAPILGWYAKQIGCIPVDRGKRGAAVAKMIEDAARGRRRPGQLIIYPQGTRVAPGADETLQGRARHPVHRTEAGLRAGGHQRGCVLAAPWHLPQAGAGGGGIPAADQTGQTVAGVHGRSGRDGRNRIEHADGRGRVSDGDPGMSRISDIAALEALYEAKPKPPALRKVAHRLTPAYRRWILASRFCVLSTVGGDGTDGSPRGDDGPVVAELDPATLLMPDWRGNNRLDSLRNIVADGRVSLMFMVPGSNAVVRVNGTAWLSTDAGHIERFGRQGKRPRCVIVIEIAEIYVQCARALMRARLWTAGDESADLPSLGDILSEMTDGEIDGTAFDTDWSARAAKSMW